MFSSVLALQRRVWEQLGGSDRPRGPAAGGAHRSGYKLLLKAVTMSGTFSS